MPVVAYLKASSVIDYLVLTRPGASDAKTCAFLCTDEVWSEGSSDQTTYEQGCT